jgi:hypothetical protein
MKKVILSQKMFSPNDVVQRVQAGRDGTHRSERHEIRFTTASPRMAPLEISNKLYATMRGGPPAPVTPCDIPETAQNKESTMMIDSTA